MIEPPSGRVPIRSARPARAQAAQVARATSAASAVGRSHAPSVARSRGPRRRPPGSGGSGPGGHCARERPGRIIRPGGPMDATTLNTHLEKHLRVATFPLGIRPLRPGEPFPHEGPAAARPDGREGRHLPGPGPGPPLRLDHGLLGRGPLLPHRQGGLRLRGAQRLLHLRHPRRRHVRLLPRGGRPLRGRARQVRRGGDRRRRGRAARPHRLRAGDGARLRELGPGAAAPQRLPLREGRRAAEPSSPAAATAPTSSSAPGRPPSPRSSCPATATGSSAWPPTTRWPSPSRSGWPSRW